MSCLDKSYFFDPHEWFPVPADWSSNIVTGKVYSTETDIGAALLKELLARTRAEVLFDRERKAYEGDGFAESEQARYGEPIPITPRLGQGAFRIKTAEAYRFECALSDTRVLPALEAAHIRPYSEGGSHSLSNGIFLRKDIHSVLDAGFATISDELRFHVSNKIYDVFRNGSEYKKMHGKEIKLPLLSDHRPALESIRWHQTERYVGD